MNNAEIQPFTADQALGRSMSGNKRYAASESTAPRHGAGPLEVRNSGRHSARQKTGRTFLPTLAAVIQPPEF